jgi:hypothetical protein
MATKPKAAAKPTPAKKPTNIYDALTAARAEFHSLKLEKTGENTFSNYKYFELSDFLVAEMDCLSKQGLMTLPVDFGHKYATMTLVGHGEQIVFRSPMVQAEYLITDKSGNKIKATQGAHLKGCHPIQNVGAVETYQRRYLHVALMEIIEHDALDATVVDDKPAARKPAARKPAAKTAAKPVTRTAAKKPVEKVKTVPADMLIIDTDEDAEALTDLIIDFAGTSKTARGLVEFWKKNPDPINLLKEKYPDHYGRLKTAFGEFKNNLKGKS